MKKLIIVFAITLVLIGRNSDLKASSSRSWSPRRIVTEHWEVPSRLGGRVATDIKQDDISNVLKKLNLSQEKGETISDVYWKADNFKLGWLCNTCDVIANEVRTQAVNDSDKVIKSLTNPVLFPRYYYLNQKQLLAYGSIIVAASLAWYKGWLPFKK